jgi:hypothetical protein
LDWPCGQNPGRRPEGRRRALTREAMSSGEQSSTCGASFFVAPRDEVSPVGGPGAEPNVPWRYRADTMLYEVLMFSNGGDRFTIEREEPFANGDTFEEDSESYRVLAIEPGHGPFAGVIEAERLSSLGLGENAPV